MLCAMPPPRARAQAVATPSLFDDLLSTATALPLLLSHPETSHGAPALPTGIAPGMPMPTPPVTKLAVLGKTIDQAAGAVKLRGYLARPMEQVPKGGVLFVPEMWGVNQGIRDHADAVAAKGFNVLVVDLYGGATPSTRGEAVRLMAQVKPEAALQALRAAVDYLSRSDAAGVPARPVALVGWGFGGGLALQFALQDPRPVALVTYYGDVVSDQARLAKIKMPILGIFANLDGWVTPARVEEFRKALASAGATFNTFGYDVLPGFALTPHGAQEASYARLADEKVLDFVTRQLGAGGQE